MTEAIPRAHAYVRVRQLPTLLIWLAFRLGMGRLVVVTGSLPHDPECTDEIAVTRSEAA